MHRKDYFYKKNKNKKTKKKTKTGWRVCIFIHVYVFIYVSVHARIAERGTESSEGRVAGEMLTMGAGNPTRVFC